MIIRKPYAFLIKNYRKIHIVLFVLSLFIAYKLFDVSAYVNEFMRSSISFDLYANPVENHIDFFLTFSLFLVMIGSAALLFLLYYKKKPWKIYLAPLIECFLLLFVLMVIKGFFNSYNSTIETTDLRLSRDLLLIFIIGHLGSVVIFAMRSLGLDISKFQFNLDQEFLELSEKDREEVEVGLSFDKYSLIRGVKKTIRNLKYFYGEHKGLCRIVLGITILVITYRLGVFFFVTHRTYKEGDSYSVDGYSFKINKAYYTDKDYHGDIITSQSAFIIVSMTISNYSETRTIYLENFHLKNGSSDYVTSNKIYAKEFQDLGNASESTTKLKKGESVQYITIYKVDKNLSKNNFALYYQEKSGSLRKIKLQLRDVSKIEEAVELSVGDEIKIDFKDQEEIIRFDYISFKTDTNYIVRRCDSGQCNFSERAVTAADGRRILKIDFSSDNYEVKDMLDFFKNYANIVYIDQDDEEFEVEVKSAVSDTYSGKSIYLDVPVDILQAKKVYFDFIMRNKHYMYDIGEIYE